MADSQDKNAVEWRSIPSFPDYEVSEYGDVRRATRGRRTTVGRIRKPSRRRNGRIRHTFLKDGRKLSVEVGRLVAEAFLGPKPFPEAVVAHWDDDQDNNYWRNLRYTTHAGNMRDMVRNGHSARGEANCNARLTDEIVRQIRDLYEAGGVTYETLARQYGVALQNIAMAVKRKSWKHVP